MIPAPCHAEVTRAVLPVWASAGFSDPSKPPPYVLGRSGRIAAILFGYPLRTPPAKNRNNKILWVSRDLVHGTALWIRAQRYEGSRPVGPPVTRLVRGGPGPSIVDLPAAGCWRLRLSWSERTDVLDVAYGRGS